MSFTKLIKRIATGSNEDKSFQLIKNEKVVKISKDIETITVDHKGKKIIIKREQDPRATIPSLFNKTSRPCPPFCVQPMIVAPDVETIGELELLDYLKKNNDDSIVIVDSRIQSWVDTGTIPGSIHIPWTSLSASDDLSIRKLLLILEENFSVKITEELDAKEIIEAFKKENFERIFDFSEAKKAILFCNGSWCAQTSESVHELLALGYPAEKLKYYREGMQGWVSFGLTIAVDEKQCDLNIEPKACER